MIQPLALTDRQLELVNNAAALLAPSERDGFLRSIANRVADGPRSDAAVTTAIQFVLSAYGYRKQNEANHNNRSTTPQYDCGGCHVGGDYDRHRAGDGAAVSEQPLVSARADVMVQKSPSQKRFGLLTRRQTRMVISAASLLGTAAAQEFATTVFNTIRDRISNADFAFVLRQLLAEYDSEELADKVFNNNLGVQN